MLKRWLHPQKEEGTFTRIRVRDTSARRTRVFLLLGAMVICGWAYVFFRSDLFQVSRLEIEGVVYRSGGEVEQEVYAAMAEQGNGPWQRKNLVLLNTDTLAESLQTRLYAESVAVEKLYPNVLRLKIRERQSRVIVIANDELYLIDRNGIGTERISTESEREILERISRPSPTAKTDLPLLTIQDHVFFLQGERFVEADTVERWLGAFHELSQAGFGYRNAVLDHPTSTKLVLSLFEPYDVYVDLLAPVRPQIEGYYAFMKAKDPGTVIKTYVDLRVPGRIYYK